MATSIYGRVGELLIKAGVVDATGLARASEVKSAPGTTLGRVLSTLGLANESAVAAAIASGLRLEYVQGQPPDAADAVAQLLPEAFCRQYRVAPLSFQGAALTIAVTDPLDYSAVQAVEFRTGKRVTPVVVTQTWLETLLSRRYQKLDQSVENAPERLASYDQLLARDPTGEVEVAVVEQEVNLSALADQPPIVRLVNLILSDAAKAGASDVHIEPHETQLKSGNAWTDCSAMS